MSRGILKIQAGSFDESIESLQAVRNGLAERKRLNTRIAVEATAMTRDYLRGLNRHGTAEDLGASPTYHYEQAAKRLEADADDEAAIIRMARASGLGRAFRELVIKPGSGKVFLTIPAVAETYGRRAREFAPGELSFTVIGGRFPALVFTATWTVAYWLAREVTQEQDRTLLPSDAGYRRLASGVVGAYIAELKQLN